MNAAPHQNAHQGTTAAHVAAIMRGRLNRPPPPPARADKALAQIVATVMVAGAAGTGLAYWLTQPVPIAPDALQVARVGQSVLAVPKAMTGPSIHDSGQIVGLARLRLEWPTLGPASANSLHVVHVTVTPPDKTNDADSQLQTFSRFLAPTAWSNPGGLVVRSFSKGSPYENDELYLALPDGRAFAARCPITPSGGSASGQPEEQCRTTIRHRGMDVALRFPREILTEWESLTARVRDQIDGMLR
jgi:hypothetical protein